MTTCSGLIENPVNIDHLYQFGKEMQSLLDIKLKDILPKALLGDDIDKLRESRYPFLDFNQTFGPVQIDNFEDESVESLMAELSSHPVHLVTKNSKTSLPSAFIPFCAYKTDLLLLGEYIEGLEFPVCNKFVPTVLDRQLCYTLDISSALPNMETIDGKDGELMLLLDYNKERSVSSQRSKKTINGNGKRYISMKDAHTDDDQEARIFIHTLKAFSGFGGGSYSMNSLKRMSPTVDFLKLPIAKKGCANDDRQHCLMRKYMKQKQRDCGCVPWEFPRDSNSAKVTNLYNEIST